MQSCRTENNNGNQAISEEVDCAYGKCQMLIELANRGLIIGLYKAASHMKKASVMAVSPLERHYCPDVGVVHKYGFNLVTINAHWVGDIIYIRSH